jgi:rhodanese-related sulfurtransferase
MRRVTVFSFLMLVVVQQYICGQNGEVTFFTPSELENAISTDTLKYDFILLDIRDDSEVESGIIATDYCKPYHMSWNFGELEEEYTLLPSDMPTIIYCRSGNRSLQAGNFLVDKGFTRVASINGGISQYSGDLADSIEFKPWSELPEPSYFAPVEIRQAGRNVFRPNINSRIENNRQFFTLQGRLLKGRFGQRNPAVFILQRIGNETAGRIEGLHKLNGTR